MRGAGIGVIAVRPVDLEADAGAAGVRAGAEVTVDYNAHFAAVRRQRQFDGSVMGGDFSRQCAVQLLPGDGFLETVGDQQFNGIVVHGLAIIVHIVLSL